MAGQSRKWMILVATIWIQAFTGTNFDFSEYSSAMKSALNISQVQLNYLATANDMGKLFGWSSGLALMYLPLSLVMFIAAFIGFVGYGLQWLLLNNFITLPYFLVFFLSFLGGCSICWFNTVCFVLCIRNFQINRPLALSLTVSYNALVPILRQPIVDPLPPDGVRRNSVIFFILNILAIFTGIYLLLFGSSTSDVTTARFYLGGALILLVSPLCIPGIIYARDWFHRTIHSTIRIDGSGFILVHVNDLELHKELLARQNSTLSNGDGYTLMNENGSMYRTQSAKSSDVCCERVFGQDQLAMLGEEHPAGVLVRRLDFWLYYVAYFCGGTIGLVYSNNLGQIAQSLGMSSTTSTLVTLYSSFSFFGRLLSAAPDYIRNKFYFARTGWLTIALMPTPIAFILLASSDSAAALHAGTAIIGLSSGFIFAAAVSVTSELFGPNSGTHCLKHWYAWEGNAISGHLYCGDAYLLWD
ncbi:hypothetical protein AAHE18_05G022200 [Arachis hypogaea]